MRLSLTVEVRMDAPLPDDRGSDGYAPRNSSLAPPHNKLTLPPTTPATLLRLPIVAIVSLTT